MNMEDFNKVDEEEKKTVETAEPDTDDSENNTSGLFSGLFLKNPERKQNESKPGKDDFDNGDFLKLFFCVLGIIGLIFMFKEFSEAIQEVKYSNSRCAYSGCNNRKMSGSSYCYKHQVKKSSDSSKYKSTEKSTVSHDYSGNSKNKSTEKSTVSYDYSGGSKNKSTDKRKNDSTVDPSDHDIDTYYEDYKDEFEDEDEAWDDFEDNEEYWDEY